MAEETELTVRDRPPGRAGAAVAPPIDEEPTVELAGDGSRSAGTTGAAAPGTAQGTVASPTEALQADEIARSRVLAKVALAISPLVALSLLLFQRDPVADGVALLGIALLASSNLVLLLIARRPETYTEGRVTVIWLVATCGLLLIVYFFGSLSAAAIALAMGLYFVSLGHSLRVALTTYVTMAVGHMLTTLLFVGDVVVDRGLITSSTLADPHTVLASLLIETLLLGIFLLGRLSRRTMLASVQELHDAVRALAQREVLLEEARQDFGRALRLGGIGRFSGAALGSYQLAEVLGRGAMGEVYRASHRETGEPAAVKVLLIEAVSQPGALARFRREAEVVSSFDSAHVTRVYEVGGEDAAVPYIAMELLEGEDLGTILRARPKLPIAEVAELVRQTGRGLEEAAAVGVVHRDIKPQNLFRTAGRHWKILDFGVSKLEGSSGTLTEGNVVGTPSYMAPEQARGHEVDHRVDLYALGAIAYRCLTGRPAFSHRELGAVLYQVVHEMPPRPSSVARLPPDVDAVLAIAMAKNRRDRFASGAELADALADAGDGRLAPELRARAAALSARQPWPGDTTGHR